MMKEQKIIYKRNCPKCSNEISYKYKYDMNRANRNNSICKKCVYELNSKRMMGNNNPAKRPEVRKKLSENHAAISGNKNPFHRIKFYGNKNPSKRSDVRKKISKKKKGIPNIKIRGKNNGNWRNGKSKDKYGYKFTNELKTKIRKRDKFLCAECLKNGRIVHHVDYNKMNNGENNLITLCSICHGKTNFNRTFWKNKFNKILKTII